jgi:dihydrofolate synthase/folylpolyglutamate synthase
VTLEPEPDDHAELVEVGPTPDEIAALLQVEHLLDQRWPETKIEPSLERISALMDLLGSPQRSYPSIHIAGTNGKTSVARMVDALLTALQRRTGRTTSPHLQSAVERIAIDGKPISPATYVATYTELEPFVQMVDQKSEAGGGPAMSKFEVLTAMAFAAFADAPIEVAVIEVGLGGRWDATNVINAPVAVITPISVDHVEFLGADIAGIAGEKVGVRRVEPPGCDRRPDAGVAGARRGLLRGVPSAARRTPGAQRGDRTGRGGGVLRRRRTASTRHRRRAGRIRRGQ